MPTALAASSMLRCVSKAATDASLLLSNLVPCPFICPILSQTDTTSRTRPPLHRQPFAIPRFPQNCLASCSNQRDGCHRRGNPSPEDKMKAIMEKAKLDSIRQTLAHWRAKAPAERAAFGLPETGW